MTTLERFSERYQPTGSLAAEGVLNQLGRPSTEPLEMLVREAVQNCWDARREGVDTVEVEIGHRTLDDEELGHLRADVLPDPPDNLPIADCLVPGIDILYFADFGTTGLGGPTRADAEPGDTTDFVDFVRNVGQPPDKALGGGSFGYGKAAFYLASLASTIVVDTHCVPEDERRLIAYGLGDHYREGEVPYTGRHWWGVLHDGVPEPLTGEAAAAMSDALGLPHRDGGDGLGTTVAIVAPRLTTADPGDDDGQLDRDAFLPFIAECLVWNFWPKMIAPPGEAPAMRFRLSGDDGPVAVPDPRAHERLAPFTRAMDALRADDAPDLADPFSSRRDLFCGKPHRRVGTLAVHQTPTDVTADPVGPSTVGAAATRDGLRHVALMRTAELIVRYEPGPAPLVPSRGYAGVFRCNPELDEAFRRSEPPTHDSWEPATLPKSHERTFVSVTPRRIREELDRLVAPRTAMSDGDVTGVSVGRFADDLAGLMPSVGGPGARRVAGGASGGRSSGGGTAGGRNGRGDGGGGGGRPADAQPRVVGIGTPELDAGEDDIAMIRTPFELETGDRRARLIAHVEVLTMDGGQVETEPPVGGVVPVPLRWSAPDGRIEDGPTATAEAAETGNWTVWVSHHPDVMVRVAIDATEA